MKCSVGTKYMLNFKDLIWKHNIMFINNFILITVVKREHVDVLAYVKYITKVNIIRFLPFLNVTMRTFKITHLAHISL